MSTNGKGTCCVGTGTLIKNMVYLMNNKLVKVMAITLVFEISGCATLGAKLAQQEVIKMAATGCEKSGAVGNVSYDDCETVTRVIKLWGINDGQVGFDNKGRLELRGTYQTEDDVDKAFVVAQTIVGAKLVSPVTPRNINVLRWRPILAKSGQDSVQNGDGRKLALLVGISKFAENEDWAIKTAGNDVALLSKSLQTHGFQKPSILVDSAATRSNIVRELTKISANAKPNDTLFVYISTHGAPPDKFGQLNIIPYDFSKKGLELGDFDPNSKHSDEEYLKISKSRYDVQTKYAVPAETLNTIFTDSNIKSVVQVLDVCYSGAALGDVFKPVGSEKFQSIERDSNFGISKHQIASALGSSGSKDLLIESSGKSVAYSQVNKVDLSSYANMTTPKAITKPTAESGKAIITASGNSEKSWYDDSDSFSATGIKESFFTHFFVEGLEKSGGQTGQAFDYAGPRTSRIVMEVKGENQNPTYATVPTRVSLDMYD
jgi:Caspase domain